MAVCLLFLNDGRRFQSLDKYVDPAVIIVAQRGFTSAKREFSIFLVYFTYLLIAVLVCTLVELAGRALWRNLVDDIQLHAFNKGQLLEGLKQIGFGIGAAKEKDKQD